MKTNLNPFTVSDLEVIDNAIAMVQALIPILQKAEKCGVDCEARKATLNTHRERLDAFKREFFKKGKPIWMPAPSLVGQAEVSAVH